jgi:hypothetical protein
MSQFRLRCFPHSWQVAPDSRTRVGLVVGEDSSLGVVEVSCFREESSMLSVFITIILSVGGCVSCDGGGIMADCCRDEFIMGFACACVVDIEEV